MSYDPDNLVAFKDPYMTALIEMCGKEAVKRYFKNNSTNKMYHEILNDACFLAANRILDFGANDNSVV